LRRGDSKLLSGHVGLEKVPRGTHPGKSAALAVKHARAGAALFENIEDGATVDDFLEWFPAWPRTGRGVLEHADKALRSRNRAPAATA